MDTNIIYCGDNLEVLSKYIPDSCVDLIYIDPPFNTSRQYEVFWGEAQERRAFEDRFGDVMTYLEWMRPRLKELHRVLKPTGSFYYHCDWHASHYVKVELDRIFGFDNFRNEIIWQRTSSHNDSKKYGQVHDTILTMLKMVNIPGILNTLNQTQNMFLIFIDMMTLQGASIVYMKSYAQLQWVRDLILLMNIKAIRLVGDGE